MQLVKLTFWQNSKLQTTAQNNKAV